MFELPGPWQCEDLYRCRYSNKTLATGYRNALWGRCFHCSLSHSPYRGMGFYSCVVSSSVLLSSAVVVVVVVVVGLVVVVVVGLVVVVVVVVVVCH